MEENIKIGTGLLKTPKDIRDFNLGGVFAPVDISEIPNIDFIIAEPLEIKNQRNSDFCTAFAAVVVSEDQEDVILSPEYLFAKEKEIMGDYRSWGADLRTACKALIEFGCIRKEFAPFNLENKDRNFLANWNNWDKNLDLNAEMYKKQSYFSVGDLGKDIFDSFRIALWQHRDKKCSILTGTIWKREWTHAENGIIKEDGTDLEGHALKIFGQKIIDGEIYLVAQLSNGTGIGDNGLFYFNREMINKNFTFGGYMFIDLEPENIKKQQWSCQIKIYNIIKKLLTWD